jgi:hypothetical protein
LSGAAGTRRYPPFPGRLEQKRVQTVEHQNPTYNIMKRLFSSKDSVEIGLLRSRLEAAGIECEMRNEHVSPTMPGAPFDPELWVLWDSQFDEASELAADWLGESASGLEPD